jgi:site-specific DNA recombinase
MKKAAAYARVSSDKQSETSIETQLDDIKAFAKTGDIQIVDTFIDKISAAGIKERPQFNDMISRALSGEFDIILVWKQNRFHRDNVSEHVILRNLEEQGIYVISVTEPIDVSTPAGRLQRWFMSGINRFYIENLQEEIRKKSTKVAMKAYFMGGTPPYGFDTQQVRDQEASRNRRVYVINEKEAPVVKLMFEKRAEGLSVYKISKLLNEKNIPTRKGGPWLDTTINDILHNSKYKGTYTYRARFKRTNGKGNSHADRPDAIEIEDAIPAIVSKELFDEVQSKFKGRRKSNASVHLLNGLMVCGNCGSQMYIAGSNRGYYKFECSGYKKHKCESYISVGETKAEKTILSYIETIINEERDYEKVAERYNKAKTMLDIQNKDRILKIQNNIRDTESKIDNALNAILEGVAPKKMEQKIKTLEKKKEDYQSELIELQQGSGKKITADEIQKEFERYTRLLKGSFDEKRELISKFIDKIEIYKHGYVKITGKKRHV